MAACSSAALEPGPLPLVDETVVDLTPSPPVFTPLAQSLSQTLPGYYSALDSAFAALVAEQAIDLGDSILGAATSLGAGSTSSVNAEALSSLQLAEDGYAIARDKIASLQSWLPPDVLAPTHVTVFIFIVQDGAGTRIPGATITIDQDVGQGSVFTTGANGNVLVSVADQSTVAWTVSAAGFRSASGVEPPSSGFITRVVTLSA